MILSHVIDTSTPTLLLNLLLKKYDFKFANTINTEIINFNDPQNICNTCNSYVRKVNVTCQAAINNLYFEKMPVEIVCLDTLELALIVKDF